jgi:chromosome partitioning protein
VQCRCPALEGLSDLVNTVKPGSANMNSDLKIIGLLRVMFQEARALQAG